MYYVQWEREYKNLKIQIFTEKNLSYNSYIFIQSRTQFVQFNIGEIRIVLRKYDTAQYESTTQS